MCIEQQVRADGTDTTTIGQLGRSARRRGETHVHTYLTYLVNTISVPPPGHCGRTTDTGPVLVRPPFISLRSAMVSFLFPHPSLVTTAAMIRCTCEISCILGKWVGTYLSTYVSSCVA